MENDHDTTSGEPRPRRDQTGALFKNLEKLNTGSPDYKGHFVLAGERYRLSAWLRDGRNGRYLSLALRRATGTPHPNTDPPVPVTDDDVAF